jgi:DNA-binding transcriptional ArsR family regulator
MNLERRVDMQLPGNVEIVTSPIFDLLASMFRLNVHERLNERFDDSTPSNTQIDSWVNNTRKILPTSVKEDLEVFFNYESFIGISLIRKSYMEQSHKSYEDFIAFLEKLSAYDLFQCFLQTGFIPKKIHNIKDEEEVLHFIKSSNLPETEKWKLTYLYFNLEETKRRFISLVQKCWNLYFTDEVDEVVAKQDESIKQLIEEFGIKDRTSLFNNFSYLERDHAIPEEATIISAPSVFYNISSLISYTDSTNIFLHLYGIHQPEYNRKTTISEEELMESFKKLADEKRIKMIKILSISPAYGYELAQMLGVSNSTVSHHLSTLASMGVVKSTRKESRVYYEVNKERLKEMMLAITEALVD